MLTLVLSSILLITLPILSTYFTQLAHEDASSLTPTALPSSPTLISSVLKDQIRKSDHQAPPTRRRPWGLPIPTARPNTHILRSRPDSPLTPADAPIYAYEHPDTPSPANPGPPLNLLPTTSAVSASELLALVLKPLRRLALFAIALLALCGFTVLAAHIMVWVILNKAEKVGNRRGIGGGEARVCDSRKYSELPTAEL
ncbi:hypothetical protein CC78DRAFT_546631 [Lojkania enalia]|uniref:Uncharacterized protein n=1 Tax=Lojkania enalia TaxID=147567 RepID=A0A9P4MXK0_9PLEO|nr:hypothetical protein CC78DRAFT_546631 [Didymosphaeria enalia]